MGVATGVESLELYDIDGEGGRGAIVGVGSRTSGFGVVRLRNGKGGGAGNRDSEKPGLVWLVSSLEYSESDSEFRSPKHAKYGVDSEPPARYIVGRG